MELEDFKKSWKEMTEARIETLESQNAVLLEKLRKQRATSIKDKLERRFRLLTILCLLSPTLMLNPFFDTAELIPFKWCFLLFFLVMAALQGRNWWRFSHIDYNQMTVKEAVKSVYETKRWIGRCQLISISLAIPLLALLFYQFYRMQLMEALYGAWLGVVIGGLAGWRIQRNIKKDLQHIKEELGEE